MARIWIKPHSHEDLALKATENTLQHLYKGGHFVVDEGHLLTQDGWIAMDVIDPEFIMWAAVHQGYVKAAALTPQDATRSDIEEARCK